MFTYCQGNNWKSEKAIAEFSLLHRIYFGLSMTEHVNNAATHLIGEELREIGINRTTIKPALCGGAAVGRSFTWSPRPPRPRYIHCQRLLRRKWRKYPDDAIEWVRSRYGQIDLYYSAST